MKKIGSLLLAGVMICSLATGCGKKEVEYDSIGTINGVEMSYDVANFAAKYQQSLYEKKYGEEDENMWVNDDGSETAMAATVKAAALSNLTNLYLCKEHMADYDVELTEIEQEKIRIAAKELIEDNNEEELELLGATQEIVTQYLTLSTIYSDVKAQIMAEIDTQISDEEAAQSTASYVKVATVDTSTGMVDEMTENEKKDAFKKLVEDLEALDGDFKTGMTAKGYEVKTISYGKDLSEVATLDPLFLQALPDLEEGKRSAIITGGDGYYVVELEQAIDETATEKKKADLLIDRANTAFTDMLTKWTKDSKYVQDDEAWESISFSHSIYAK